MNKTVEKDSRGRLTHIKDKMQCFSIVKNRIEHKWNFYHIYRPAIDASELNISENRTLVIFC